MPTVNFDEIKTKFINADLDEKIRIYTTTVDYQWLNLESYLNIIQYNTYQN